MLPNPDAPWIGILLPSANRVVEPVSHAVLAAAGLGALFARVPKRGAVDRFPDRHDTESLLAAAALLADARPAALLHAAGKGGAIGIEHDLALVAALQGAFGVPATTPLLALLAYLRSTKITRIALVGPHGSVYNQLVKSELGRHQLEVVGDLALGLQDNLAFASVSPGRLAAMVRQAAAMPGVEGVLCWNTNCALPPLVPALEQEIGMPVLDATLLGLWGVMSQLGPVPALPFGSPFPPARPGP
jgi:maleate isomerase